MNQKNKTIIINAIITVLIAITLYAIIITINNYKKELNNTIPINKPSTEEKIISNSNSNITQNITKDNIEISNINITYTNGHSLLTYIITNNSSLTIADYYLIIKDKENNPIIILPSPLTNELKPTETTNQEITCDIDLSEAHSIELELEKGEQ